MQTIKDIEENLPHEVAELICLNCHQRWIGVYPQATPLKNLECTCGVVGMVIKTGQTLPEVADEEMESDPIYQNMVAMWGEETAIAKYNAFVKGKS